MNLTHNNAYININMQIWYFSHWVMKLLISLWGWTRWELVADPPGCLTFISRLPHKINNPMWRTLWLDSKISLKWKLFVLGLSIEKGWATAATRYIYVHVLHLLNINHFPLRLKSSLWSQASWLLTSGVILEVTSYFPNEGSKTIVKPWRIHIGPMARLSGWDSWKSKIR